MTLRAFPSTGDQVRAFLEELYGDPEQDPITPQERVSLAIHRELPDRVPFDFWAVPEQWDQLRTFLGVEKDEEVLRLLGVDCRLVVPSYIGPAPIYLEDGTYIDVWGTHRTSQATAFGHYEEYARFPLAQATNAAEVEGYAHWPRTEYWDVSSIKDQIESLNRHTRYHLRYEVGGIFEHAWGMYGFEKFLSSLALGDMEVPNAIMACLTELYIQNVTRVLEAADGAIDMVYTYDDLGTQQGLLMSVDMWRENILPWHLRLNEAIRRFDVRIMYHSCGSIFPLIGPLADEMGIDVLNPLHPRAKGMDMVRIKRDFGDRLAFHGGIDLQYTLPFGSPREVQQEVAERCRILGDGGGYLCASAHYLQADVPVENVIAMYVTPRILAD